jgi:polar amino acid transport system permease protein
MIGWAQFVENFANWDSLMQARTLLLQGLRVTAWLAVVALPLALAAGLAVALLHGVSGRWMRWAVIAVIDLFRAFPVIVLLILIFYGLPFLGIRLSNFAATVLALVLNNAAYYGEIFRAGLEGVPHGQTEAARALGLRHLQSIRLVVLPQAIRRVTAPLASNSLELVKETSIAAMVALPELLRSARVAQEQTYNPTPLIAAAVIYAALLWPAARLTARLERRMLQREAR